MHKLSSWCLSSGRCQNWLSLVLYGLLWHAGLAAAAGAPPADLRAQFAEPPREYRLLKLIHDWPTNVSGQDRQLQWLITNGFGGMACNVPFGRGYVENETNWQTFLRVVREAKQAGLALWLYDEKGYPSGNAGGLVMKDHPEWEARGLLITDAETSGAPVGLEAPPGRVVLAAALPVGKSWNKPGDRVDLAGNLKDGKLNWQPPAGTWRVMIITEDRLYDGTHAAHNLYAHIPYPNLLLKEPTAKFLAVTHENYAARLDQNLGRWFMSTFTDEPSLMSLFLSPMPYRVLPWAPDLPAEFQKRRGYALEPWLPHLAVNSGAEGARARHDFWLTVGELVAENYFGQIQSWCARHQVRSGGHLLFEESLLNQVASYGDFFRCIRRLDAPSIDVLTSLPPEVPHAIARVLASAGELTGKTLVMSETSDHSQRYRAPGDQRPPRVVTEEEMRGTLNRQLVSGVNCFTTYYSYKDLMPEQLRRLNEWAGRCGLMLRGGQQAADIAVVYPTESLWVRFAPSRHYANQAAEAQRVAGAYSLVVRSLFASGRDYTVLDATALSECRTARGVLSHGALQWRVVILPQVDTLPLAAWKNLAAFVREGGVVVALGTPPANSETRFPDPEVVRLGGELFGNDFGQTTSKDNRQGGAGIFLPSGSEALLGAVLRNALQPQVQVAGGKSSLRTTHRSIAGHELFFIINDSPQSWTGKVSVCATGKGEQWHPGTGQVTPLAGAQDVVLNLGPYDGTFLRFAASVPAARGKTTTGVLPGLTMEPLPPATPTLAGGEFVQKHLTNALPQAGRPAPAWRVTGRLTKGGVDTHLFARFPYPNGLDLSDAEFLVLDSWVPAGQSCSASLLVILHEKGGADYLASTARALANERHNRSFVPLDQFHLAGWSKDANGQLDLKEISEVRIGWGGYFGRENETVEVTIALPFKLAPQ